MSKKQAVKAEMKHDRTSNCAWPPLKQALLLKCMDLRLVDDTTKFMNDLNMQNRYDQISLAGSSMGVRRLSTPAGGSEFPWKAVFFHHLVAAIEVLKREIKDIFLIEHMDCGAYQKLHPDCDIRTLYAKLLKKRDANGLARLHAAEAHWLADEIKKFCLERQAFHEKDTEKLGKVIDKDRANATTKDHQKLADEKSLVEAWKDIEVRCYLIGIDGKVEPLKRE